MASKRVGCSPFLPTTESVSDSYREREGGRGGGGEGGREGGREGELQRQSVRERERATDTGREREGGRGGGGKGGREGGGVALPAMASKGGVAGMAHTRKNMAGSRD